MQESPTDRTDFSPIIGRATTLLLLPTHARAGLIPTWAVLSGVLAANSWQWRGQKWIVLPVTLFIAEILWSTWRSLLVDLDWLAYLRTHPLPAQGDPIFRLPYTTPGSPLGKLLVKWGQIRLWMRKTLSGERRGAILAIPLLPLLILCLSALCGREILLLSTAALALSVIEWRIARNSRSSPSLQAGLEIGLCWLAGHSILAPLTWPSFTLACCYALAYQGMLSTGTKPRAWPLALTYGGQIGALIGLALWKHPLAAAVNGILCALQWLFLIRFYSDRGRAQYLKHISPLVVLSMVVSAWAV